MRTVLIFLGALAAVAIIFGLASLSAGSQILDLAHQLTGGS